MKQGICSIYVVDYKPESRQEYTNRVSGIRPLPNLKSFDADVDLFFTTEIYGGYPPDGIRLPSIIRSEIDGRRDIGYFCPSPTRVKSI